MEAIRGKTIRAPSLELQLSPGALTTACNQDWQPRQSGVQLTPRLERQLMTPRLERELLLSLPSLQLRELKFRLFQFHMMTHQVPLCRNQLHLERIQRRSHQHFTTSKLLNLCRHHVEVKPLSTLRRKTSEIMSKLLQIHTTTENMRHLGVQEEV